MQLRKTSGQIYLFRLEPALFSLCEFIELVICERIIEISLGVIQRIEIPDVSSNVIQGIEVQDVTSKVDDRSPIFCLVSQQREREVRRQELSIDGCGFGQT